MNTRFGDIHARLRDSIKLAQVGISQTTGTESSISPPGSDAEVKELLPSGGNPSGRGVSDLTGIGAAAGESLPGVNTSPKTEEKQREETSPETKLASQDPELTVIQNRLAENLKLAAASLVAASQPQESVVQPKVAGELTSLGQIEQPTDAALSSSNKADTSSSTPQIEGVKGLSQAEPVAGVSSEVSQQGPQEKAASENVSPENIEAISEKVAAFTSDYLLGRNLAAAVLQKLAAPQDPALVDQEKLAESVQNAAIISTANAMMSAGVERNVITQKQADDLMSLIGFRVNPVHAAIGVVQEKLAQLTNSPIGTNEQKLAFLEKLSEGPEAAVAAAGGEAPVDPQEIQAAIAQLLQELQQAVDSGQMTEDQALGLLQQLGLVGGEGAPPEGQQAESPAHEQAETPAQEKAEHADEEKTAAINHNRAVFGLKLANALGITPNAVGVPAALQTPPAGGAAMLPDYIPTAKGVQDKLPLSLPAAASAPAAPVVAAEPVAAPDKAIADVGVGAGAQPVVGSPVAGSDAAAGAAPGAGGSILPLLLGGLGIGGLGALAYKGLSSGNDEDERRRRPKAAEAVDPAMAAEPPPPGGDPAAAAAAAGAEANPIQQVVDDLIAMLSSGQMTPEEGLQVVQELAQSGQISPEDAQQLATMIQQSAGAAPAGGAPADPAAGGGGAPVA